MQFMCIHQKYYNSSKNVVYILTHVVYIRWLDPLLFKRYRKNLKDEDLYSIPSTMTSHSLLRKFNW